MIYRALIRFCDRQDNMFMYEAGEVYPRPGMSVSDGRLAELAGSDNRMGYPLIKAVPEAQKRPVEAVEREHDKTVEQEPKPAQKRRKSRQKG